MAVVYTVPAPMHRTSTPRPPEGDAMPLVVRMLVALSLAAPGWPGAITPARSAPHEHRIDLSDPDSGAELIGSPAPDWTFTRWVRGGPYRLADLRGRVVLIRFWNENCRFCAATLPALEQLQKQHADDGLLVIGVFHPKPPHPV